MRTMRAALGGQLDDSTVKPQADPIRASAGDQHH